MRRALLLGLGIAVASPVAAAGLVRPGGPAAVHGRFPRASAADSVLRATLPNGLRVLVVRNTLAPVAVVEVNYLVGANETPAGFPGMAHAQEHMMFRGSPGLSAAQLAVINAELGGDYDADTQQTVTQYFELVPAEDVDLPLHIAAIRMGGVLDTDSLWRHERGAIEQEVARDLSSPTYVFTTRLRQALFGGTPYAQDALGTRPSFDRTTGAMLHRFYERWYTPNNAVLLVVGDVDPPAVLGTVRRLFGGIPAHPLPARPAIHFQPVRPQTLRMTTDLPYGLALLSFRLPGSRSPDHAAAQVLADVLSSQRGPLYALVTRGKALFAGFEAESMPAASMGFALGAFPSGASGDSLLDRVRRTLFAEVRAGLPADLVRAAQRDELTAAESQKNSAMGLTDAWSEAVAVNHEQSPAEEVAAIQRVTVDDVNRVARTYLDPAHMISAVLTPQPSGQPVASRGFGGKESFAPGATHAVALPDWARQALGHPTLPPSTVHPVVDTLANGLKLIIQPERVSHIVSVLGAVKRNGDLETPPGKEGVESVLDRLFDYGTTSLDRLAFQKALDDIGADESAGGGFSLTVLSDHFERGVELLAQNELHPALPAPDFAIVRRQTARTLAGEMQSPDYLFGRALQKALLPAGDPALRHATPGSVDSLALADVHAAYDHVFRPDMTTIVVIGDVTPERARAVIERYFGPAAWRASGPRPPTELPALPPNRASTVAVPDRSRVQDRVVLDETLGLTRADSDRYALELGNHVLGGGFYATRLYHDLREEAGLVYTVGSSFDIGKTRSFYDVDYASDPDNVARARTIVVRDLRAMQTSPVTPQELQLARAMALRAIPVAESSESSIAGGLLARAVAGIPLDEPTIAAQHYLRIDAAQIQAAFRRWVRPDDFVQVSQGPRPM